MYIPCVPFVCYSDCANTSTSTIAKIKLYVLCDRGGKSKMYTVRKTKFASIEKKSYGYMRELVC